MKKTAQRFLLMLLSLVMLLSVASCGKKDRITLKEFVALDIDECSITVKGIEINGDACSIELELKNKSKNENLIFATDTSYVDGLECSFDLSEEVEHGKTATVKTNLALKQKSGYSGKFGRIDFNYIVFNAENFSSIVSDTAVIFPYGEAASSTYSRDLANDDVVINSNGVSLSVVGYSANAGNGVSVTVYMENNTDKEIVIEAADEDINGEFIGSYFSDTLPAGKRKYSNIVWFQSDLDDFAIEKVEYVNIYLYASDSKTQEFIADGYASLVVK